MDDPQEPRQPKRRIRITDWERWGREDGDDSRRRVLSLADVRWGWWKPEFEGRTCYVVVVVQDDVHPRDTGQLSLFGTLLLPNV